MLAVVQEGFNMSELDTNDNIAKDIDSPSVDKVMGRDSRSQSQDELLSPHIGAISRAIDKLNATSLDDLAKKNLWTADTVIDSQKIRNLLHSLVLSYGSALEAATIGTVSELNQKFENCVTVLTQNGVDINEGDISRNTPLHLACQQDGVDTIIKVLLASGAKVNTENANQQTPLHLAIDNGGVKEVECLLNAGADPNLMDCVGKSALHNAVKYRRNHEVIKLLAGCGADIGLQEIEYRQNKGGSTPLHIAVRHDRKENVRLLLELGAAADVENSSGQTPLHMAACYDITAEITQMLLQGGATVNYKDAVYRESPLHKAIKRNMVENVKTLCTFGASLSITDYYGESALHIAAIYCQNIEIWIALLGVKGADINIRNSKAQTVLDRAARSSNKLAVNVLKQIQG